MKIMQPQIRSTNDHGRRNRFPKLKWTTMTWPKSHLGPNITFWRNKARPWMGHFPQSLDTGASTVNVFQIADRAIFSLN